ncbi:MAG: thiamine pyrophosphate-dependent enzyme [Lyngbya sp.]|nr:thiamine pyrophosphate-dependent enzyme [Lyngbya sp.]
MKRVEFYMQKFAYQTSQIVVALPGRESEEIIFEDFPAERLVLPEDENTGAYAAIAATIVHKYSPHWVFYTLGPGGNNATNAIDACVGDKIPVIFVFAQTEEERIHFGATHQCADHVSIAKALGVKYACQVFAADVPLLPSILRNAVSHALTEPLGPAVLSIPIDVLAVEYDFPEVDEQPLQLATPDDPMDVQPAVAAFLQAENPIFLVGNQLLRDGLVNQFRALVKLTGAGVVQAYDCVGVLPSDHPNLLYTATSYAGGISGVDVNDLVFEPTDCIISFGFDWKDDLSNKHLRHGRRKINWAFSASIPDAERGLFDGYINGDLPTSFSTFFNTVSSRLTEKFNPHDVSAYWQALKSLSSQASENVGVNIVGLCRAINAQQDGSIILASDVGLFRHYLIMLTETRGLDENLPVQLILSPYASSFGTGIGYGIGAALSCENPVIAVCGDGGFNHAVGALRTIAAKREQLTNLVLIVFDNSENFLIGGV